MDVGKTASFILLTAIGGAAALWLYNNLSSGDNSPATSRAVSDTTKGDVTTTPIQLSKVAAVAIGDPLKWIGSVTNRAAQAIPSNLSNGSVAQDWRIPFGNPESQAAAASATKATNVSNYRPTAWSSFQFRTGV